MIAQSLGQPAPILKPYRAPRIFPGGRMLSLRRWLPGLILSFSLLAQTAPQLTTIQDLLYNADGSRFNGIATISWQSFDSASGSTVASHVLQVPIASGIVDVQLVPTSNVNPQLTYSVTYTSNGGVQYSETWSVP